MNDIVERLSSRGEALDFPDDQLMQEAANEIERLQAKLSKAVEALENMKPHVATIKRAIPINDDMGRVVHGQTEAAAELSLIHAIALREVGSNDDA